MTTAIYQVNKSNARLKIFIFDGHSNLEDESVLQFYGCNEGVNELGESWDNYDWCRDFKGKAHPVFFIISIVFLIITLLVYLAEDSLRCIRKNKNILKNPIKYGFRKSNALFSRLTMGFIINLTITLILLTVEAMKSKIEEEDDRETTLCEVKAYLTLYFFLVSNFGKT